MFLSNCQRPLQACAEAEWWQREHTALAATSTAQQSCLSRYITLHATATAQLAILECDHKRASAQALHAAENAASWQQEAEAALRLASRRRTEAAAASADAAVTHEVRPWPAGR